MRQSRWLLCLGLIGLTGIGRAQDGAAPAGVDSREIPVPPIATAMASLPSAAELPSRPEMPDVMVMNDGTKVTSRPRWQQRREEMRQILSYYAVGRMPPAPGNVKGREIHRELVLDGTASYRLIRLTFGPKEQLGLDVGVFAPVTEVHFLRSSLPVHVTRRTWASSRRRSRRHPGARRRRSV